MYKKGVHLLRKSSGVSKKHGPISYAALAVGVVCFFVVFVEPTKIANVGNLLGDYVAIFLTIVGIVLSVIGLIRNNEKNIIPTVSLILSLSWFIFWTVALFLLFTGQIPFAPRIAG